MKFRGRAGKSELQKLQKKIFHSLLSEAESLLGPTPKEILKYEETFRAELRKQFAGYRVSTRKKLLEKASRSDLVLIGDYHTYQQAQRTALRLLRELVREKREFTLGLELVSSRHQRYVDLFMRGKIPVKEFLKKIDYDKNWGFPWEHYAPLFELAQAHGIRVIALNRPKELLPPLVALKSAKKSGDLGARDEWAAGLILDEIHEGRKVIAIYGELHLAPSHIPEKIRLLSELNHREPPKTLILHQNQDELFWKLAKENLEQTTGIVELKGGDFCVFSGTPWTRLQSLINWLQGDLASFTDEEEDPEEEFVAWMKSTGARLGEFFGVTPPPYDSLTVYGAGDSSWAKRRAISPNLTRALVESQERIYWKESPADADLYAPAYTENSAAELSAIHLLHGQSKRVKLFDGEWESALGVILDHAFGFFCSLLINPRRKCSLREDHQARLRALSTGKTKPRFRHEKESHELFLKLDLDWRKNPGLIPERLHGATRKSAVLYTASHYFGHRLGKEIHERLLRGELSPENIREALIDLGKKSPRTRWAVFTEALSAGPRRGYALPGESL